MRWKICEWILCAAAIVALANAAVATGDHDAEADELFEDYFRWRLRTHPEQATMLGFHEYDSKLSDFSPAAAVKREISCKSYQKRALALLKKPLGPRRRHYVKNLSKQAGYCVDGMKLGGHYLSAVNFMGSVQIFLPRLFKSKGAFVLERLGDFDKVFDRLQAIPKMLEGIQETLKQGIKQNITFSAGPLSRIDGQFDSLQVSKAEQSVFFVPFAKIDRFVGGSRTKANITEKAKKIIMESILPAFQRLNTFVQEEYMQHLRPTHGVLSLPNGEAFYQQCLEHHTTMEGITAKEVHQIGLDAVEELKQGVMKIAEKMGKGQMEFSDFLGYIRDSPEFKFHSKEEGLELFNDVIRNKINGQLKAVLPERLLTDEVYELDIVVPAGTSGTASYSPGDGADRPGTFYVNLNDLDVFQKTVATTLALHEAVPGHHFQFVHDRAQDFPDFLRLTVSGPTSLTPSNVPSFNAHIEGWGLYSEFLGREMGVFDDDDFQLLGHFSYNLLRAARLVVDTGMHAFGWDRTRVVDYLLSNTAFSRAYAELQADRYAGWPGQAVSYKMGERAIRALREKKENELARFDLREFHADYLACLGFMDDLEECVSQREQDRGAMLKRTGKQRSGGNGQDEEGGNAAVSVAVSILALHASLVLTAIIKRSL